MATHTPGPFLYLTMEAPFGEAARERLRRALDAAPIAALLLSPGSEPPEQALKQLIALAQGKGVAVLTTAEPALARSLGADGIHVPWSVDVTKTFEGVRAALVPPYMAGADAGRSRHDAMAIGERGADYVAFGIPQHVEDREKAKMRRLELVAWWAEIFEVPVVAFNVETPAEAGDLLEAGADFIAIRLPQTLPAADVPDWIRSYSTLLSAPQATA